MCRPSSLGPATPLGRPLFSGLPYCTSQLSLRCLGPPQLRLAHSCSTSSWCCPRLAAVAFNTTTATTPLLPFPVQQELMLIFAISSGSAWFLCRELFRRAAADDVCLVLLLGCFGNRVSKIWLAHVREPNWLIQPSERAVACVSTTRPMTLRKKPTTLLVQRQTMFKSAQIQEYVQS